MSNSLWHNQTINQLITQYVELGQQIDEMLGVAHALPTSNSAIDRRSAIKRQYEEQRGFLSPDAPPRIKGGDPAVVKFLELGPRGDLFITSERPGKVRSIDAGIEVETPEISFPKSKIGAVWGGSELGRVDVECDLIWRSNR